ncbi:predicted protein [Aspergillus terreus NIH2624]|uniref:Uncharacterized protein n=1 Tax=Aspergillus terreus (strain NIH 2624 / FGSC A1156) TaxID=341663 RepID=Q0CW05_ASPTN|nr:uncharacterized protein ATEG_02129 [Aspergillus terreus NIH2624]EAU37091.1 predicted protein [Aspergillus terreus NIH2624]
MLDAAIPGAEDASPTSYRGYRMLADEILSEDPVLGQRVLDGMISWGGLDVKTYPDTFSSLTDYMVYRVEDVGADLIFRTAEFACGLQLPQREMDALNGLRSLCARHILLTNDLYSYEKEAAAEKKGVKLFNAVRVVQDLMGVSALSAKGILRSIIWDVERRMNEEYEHLVAEKSSESQLVRARALVACVAGNMYFSATCARYARVVDGARLAA